MNITTAQLHEIRTPIGKLQNIKIGKLQYDSDVSLPSMNEYHYSSVA